MVVNAKSPSDEQCRKRIDVISTDYTNGIYTIEMRIHDTEAYAVVSYLEGHGLIPPMRNLLADAVESHFDSLETYFAGDKRRRRRRAGKPAKKKTVAVIESTPKPDPDDGASGQQSGVVGTEDPPNIESPEPREVSSEQPHDEQAQEEGPPPWELPY